MIVRKATIDDLEIVLKYAYKQVLLHQTFNPIRYSALINHEKLLEEYLTYELNNDKSIINVLCINDKILGYSQVKFEEDSLVECSSARAWLHDIFIDEKVRGLGGGKMLLEASKQAALSLGSSTLMLHVATQNKFAENFYAENGFEVTLTEMMFRL